ncbi:MAG: serine/threonine-protein kinase [Polyangiales bacterium]
MDEAGTIPAGTRFGPYVVERLLGQGAMGAVYRATHARLGKPVVLKLLHAQHAGSAEIVRRFEREGRAAAAIRHPHVVDVTDVGEEGGVAYLVMEFLEGESLAAFLERHEGLAADRSVDLLLPVIAAVDAAHAAGVVHRDLKPENLFITRTATGEPHPKVLDFGISRVVSDGGLRAGTATLLGTPAYMAPEQVEQSRDADARSDQYALGVILYECLTGVCPFQDENIYRVLKRVGDGVFTAPRGLAS